MTLEKRPLPGLMKIRQQNQLSLQQLADAAGVPLRVEYQAEIGVIVEEEDAQKLVDALSKLTGKQFSRENVQIPVKKKGRERTTHIPGAEAHLLIPANVDFHARPARLLVQTAAQFQSQIWIEQGEKVANAKNFIGVLMLGARRGQTIRVYAEGEDAEEAVKTLSDLVNRAFGEE